MKPPQRELCGTRDGTIRTGLAHCGVYCAAECSTSSVVNAVVFVALYLAHGASVLRRRRPCPLPCPCQSPSPFITSCLLLPTCLNLPDLPDLPDLPVCLPAKPACPPVRLSTCPLAYPKSSSVLSFVAIRSYPFATCLWTKRTIVALNLLNFYTVVRKQQAINEDFCPT